MSQHPSHPFSTSCAAIAPLELMVSGPGWEDDARRLFEQPFVLIGRDARSCLRLEDDAVSRRHAYLQPIGERVFCVDLGSRSGTRWAGESRPAGWLRPKQVIEIGPFTLELANTAWTNGLPLEESIEAGNPLLDRINDQPNLPRFNIAVGNEVRTQFRMNRELVLVGTSQDCRVRLRDAGISRHHCSLLKTPEGIWVVDLLSATGTRLNGEPIRWARMNEGDLLRVGPYLLRLGYEDEIASARSLFLPEDQMDAPLPQSADTAKSERMPAPSPALQAELDQLRERLRDTELLRQHLADREAECTQLRQQAETLDNQSTELAELKARLEVAETVAGKLEEVGSERDHWQARTQFLQGQMESGLSEREDLRRQLAAVQQQLAEEREAVHAANVRLVQQSSIVQQLQETDGELARARDMMRALQAELDQSRGHLQDVEALKHQLADARGRHDESAARVRELEVTAELANRLQDQIRGADIEMERLHDQLRAAQSQVGELEGLRTECVRSQEQIRALEIQIAEMEDLKRRLESAEGNLEDVYSERDHWHSETHALRTQIATDVAEREELRRQLESAQMQLAQEREAVCAVKVQLDQQSAVLQQLQGSHEELACARDKMRELHSELDQARGHQQVADVLRQQLADARSRQEQLTARVLELEGRAASADHLPDRLRNADAEIERLRQQVRVLELRVTEADDFIARLESAAADARNLEEVSSERDRWQVEAQTLRNRIASDLVEREQFVQLTAELLAVQAERDRLLVEHSATTHEVEKTLARVSELEGALTEATAAYEKTLNEERAGWEAERQTLKTLIEQARTADHDSAQAVIREVQARSAAEREELRLRLEGAEAQIVCERGLFQEQSEQSRRQIAALRAERDRLVARPAQTEPPLPTVEARSPDKPSRPVETSSAPHIALQDRALALFCGIDLGYPPQPSGRGQGANKPVEPGRPRVAPANEWTQGGQQVGPSSIEQGVEDAWMQAAAERQGPVVQTDAENTSNPSDSAQRQAEIVEDKQLQEVLHACLSQPRLEEQQGLWRRILNLVRRK